MSFVTRVTVQPIRLAHRAGPVLKRDLNIKAINGGIQAIPGTTHAHANLSHLPFDYKHKGKFLGKFAVFCSMGFSIPFGAVLYKRTPQA